MKQIIVILLILMSGASLGITESVNHKFDRSLARNANPQWWQVNKPGESHLNKWADRDGNPKTRKEAFPLSSTLLTPLTDAYHFFKALCLACIFFAVSMIYRFGLFKSIGRRFWYLHFAVWWAVFNIGWYSTWQCLPELIF